MHERAFSTVERGGLRRISSSPCVMSSLTASRAVSDEDFQRRHGIGEHTHPFAVQD
jgi:hypothetical protein